MYRPLRHTAEGRQSSRPSVTQASPAPRWLCTALDCARKPQISRRKHRRSPTLSA